MASETCDTNNVYIFDWPREYRFVGTYRKIELHIVKMEQLGEALVPMIAGTLITALCGHRFMPQYSSTMKLSGDVCCAACWAALPQEQAPKSIEV